MIEAVGAVLGNETTAVEQTGLGQEDFLEILLTQFTYQAPLKPLDNEEFVAQLAQFASLVQSRQTSENTNLLLRAETVAQAFRLLGRVVEVAVEGGSEVGRVNTITFDREGTPRLTIETSSGQFLTDIGLSQVGIINDGEES